MTRVSTAVRRVLITDCDFGDGSVEAGILGEDVELTFLGSRDPARIVEAAAGHDGLFVQWADIDEATLDALPGLRGIVRYGIGLDNIDLESAKRHGVSVSNVDDYCLDEVADHAAAAIYAANRRYPQAAARVRDGEWGLGPMSTPLPPHADPVGIAGMGRIGRSVAARLVGLGFPIHYFDPQVEASDLAGLNATRWDTVEALAGAVNHLSLHVPLMPATRGLVGGDVARALGPDGHLVNTSRGGLVDEVEVTQALDAGELGWATLDVFTAEPPVAGPSAALAHHPRVTATPHLAYLSTESLERLRRNAALRMKEML